MSSYTRNDDDSFFFELFPEALVPEGRVEVEVQVKSVGEKIHASTAFGLGVRRVMTVGHADGWSAWGSRVDGVEVGDKILLRARFERSPKNVSFGFFRNPFLVKRLSGGVSTSGR